MGQKVSVSQEEKNELSNLFGLGQSQNAQAKPETHPAVMMRMMAPTALGPRRSSLEPPAPVVKQQVMKPPAPVRKQRVREPAAKVRRSSKRQAQQVGQQVKRK